MRCDQHKQGNESVITRLRKHPIGALSGAIALLTLFIVLGYAVYLASEAGELPWQTDPTRIPVTPFGDIPGFSVPTPLPTAAP